MKKRIGLTFLALCVCLGGCAKNTENSVSVLTIDEEVVPKTESLVVESISEIMSEQSIENDTVVRMETLQKNKEYSNISINFSYPSEWELIESRGEDGASIRLYDTMKERREVIRLEQGGDWRVDLEATEEYYYEIYKEQYNDMKILSISEMMIDGCDARKIEFTFTENEQEFTGIKYMAIEGFVSFEFTCITLTELFADYEAEIIEIIESVKLTVLE